MCSEGGLWASLAGVRGGGLSALGCGGVFCGVGAWEGEGEEEDEVEDREWCVD